MNDLIRHVACTAAYYAAPGSMRDIIRIVATLVLGAALGWHSVNAPAREQPGDAPALEMAQLERAFWLCDHAATRDSVDPQLGMLCVNVTDQLKQQKFDGDAERMLAWWRLHKVAQHKMLDAAAQ
jgi:hypothetical protein